MINLVCLDRDGTINEDDNHYLGSSENWKSQIKILPGVIEGIKRLNNTSNLEIFILTNQSGVALKGEKFSKLTLERMYEVNNYNLNILRNNGVFVRGYFACPYIDFKYVERAKLEGREVNPDFIKDNPFDLKPNIGMIKKAVNSLGKTWDECNIYAMGDRISDILLGLNSGGTGILVKSQKTKEIEDIGEAKNLKEKGEKVYIAKDFLDAVDYIIRDSI